MPLLIRRRPLATIVLAAVLLRLALVPLYAHLPGPATDEMFWKQWMQAIHEHGVLNVFRGTNTDYVGYHWVLWLMASAYAVIGGPYTASTPSLHALVKMPSIAFDVALIYAVFEATRLLAAREGGDEARAQRLALLAAAVIALQPAVVYDSAVWAQTDAAIAAAMLASVVLLSQRRPATGWAIWTLGFLVKPHPVIIVPVLVVLTARCGWRAAVRSMASVVAVVALVLGPWLLHGDGARIVEVYHSLFDADYGRLSMSAWNAWWFRDVAAHPGPDAPIWQAAPLLTYRLAGLLMSAAAGGVALAFVLHSRRMSAALIAAAYLAFAFYMLPVSTHERYLYPFIALLLPVCLVDKRWLWIYVPASATFFLNLVVTAPPIASLSGRWSESPLSLVVAAVNGALFLAMTVVLVRVEVRAAPRVVWRVREYGARIRERGTRTPERAYVSNPEVGADRSLP
jgi:Gpi18-like mannosyltransferase